MKRELERKGAKMSCYEESNTYVQLICVAGHVQEQGLTTTQRSGDLESLKRCTMMVCQFELLRCSHRVTTEGVNARASV